MGNCCSVTATVPSSRSPPSLEAGSALAPEARDVLPPSSERRSRTTSMPAKLHSEASSQVSKRRIRMESAPQPPRSKSSRQNQRVAAPRGDSIDCRTSGPEQPNVGVSAPTVSCSIRNPRLSNPSTAKQRMELQVFRGNTIRASIEAGRNGGWRNLCSSIYFMDKPLKSCVDVIHTGIVDIWNLNDTNRYLSSDQFKISMSHVVKDLAVPAHGASRRPDRIISGDEFAKWVYMAYEGRQEIVQSLMGYIVDLHVILDNIVKTAICNVTDVMNEHVRSGRRDSIHRDIRNFVTETYAKRFTKDLILEKIIDLIRQYCSLEAL